MSLPNLDSERKVSKAIAEVDKEYYTMRTLYKELYKLNPKGSSRYNYQLEVIEDTMLPEPGSESW